MNTLWHTLLRIFWSLRPVMALEANLTHVIQLGFALFTSDDLDDDARDPRWRAKIAAAMFDAHRKLDLLIYHRACEIIGRPTRLGFKPDYSHTPASTDLNALWRSFERFVAKFDDYERLAQRRAAHMKRHPPALRYGGPLRLDATHRSTSPALRTVEANHRRLASLSAQHWGRWIARTCAQDGLARRSAAQAAGGACVSARGPPHSHSPFPTPTPQSPRDRDRTHMTNTTIEPCATPVMVRPNRKACP